MSMIEENFDLFGYDIQVTEVRGLARRTKGRGVKDIPVKGAVNERPDQKLHLNGKDAWVPNCSMFGVQDTHGYLKVHGENM